MDTSQFRGLNIGVELVGIPEVLELLKLLVVLHDVLIGEAGWGGVCRDLGHDVDVGWAAVLVGRVGWVKKMRIGERCH